MANPILGTPVVIQNTAAIPVSLESANLDTDGAKVPVNKAHTYTYDDSGNMATDTVTDGTLQWVRTYSYANGQMRSDSGWVRQ